MDNLHPKALALLRDNVPRSAPKSRKTPGDIHRLLSTSAHSNTTSNPRIVELHGTLAKVHCLASRHERPRDEYQEELAGVNPIWEEMAEEAERTGVRPRTNPDGDVSM